MSPSNTKEDLVKQFHKIHLKSMEHCHGLRQQTSVKMAQFIQELQQLDLDREKSTKKATEKIKLMNAKEKDILAQIKTERKAAQDKIEREKEKQLKEQAELERLEAAKAIELQNKEADRLQKEAAATAAEKERQSKIQDSEVKLANKAAVKEDQSLYGAICQRYLLHYEEFKKTLDAIESNLAANHKKEKLEMRMRVHKRIGQISKSLQQIDSIAQDLVSFLNEQKSNQAAYYYVIHLICEKVIEQAESQIASYQPSAFFIAMTLVRLFSHHDYLQTVFIGKIMTCCPFTLGVIPSSKPHESQEDYMKRVGYVYKTSQSSFETTDSWQDRMAGMLSLFSALLQTQLTPGGPLYDPALGWMYLSFVLNSQPQAQTPLLLVTFLEMAGYGLFLVYRQAFQKLLLFMRQVYVPYLASQRGAGVAMSIQGLTRLEVYLKQVLETNRGMPSEPEGRTIR